MPDDVLTVGRLELRPSEFVACVDGVPLNLTVRELQLLAALAARRDRIVSRQELYSVVWRRPFRQEERSVDVYVRRLRNKLEEALPDWVFIHTHYGFGYRLSPQPVRVSSPRARVSPVLHMPATDR
jgi:DNA-binding response OmpR family regulator